MLRADRPPAVLVGSLRAVRFGGGSSTTLALNITMGPSPDFLLLPLFYAWSGLAYTLAIACVQYLFALNVRRRSIGESSVSKLQAGIGRLLVSAIGMGGIAGFARLLGHARGTNLIREYEAYCAIGLLAGIALGIYVVYRVHTWLPATHNEG